jgi:hypothetical protein
MMMFGSQIPPPPHFCLAVREGYEQFPAICRRTYGHIGPHESRSGYQGEAFRWHDAETIGTEDVIE